MGRKNTKPKIWSDERHRQKLNGFLTVEVRRGSTRVDFRKQSSTEMVVGGTDGLDLSTRRASAI